MGIRQSRGDWELGCPWDWLPRIVPPTLFSDTDKKRRKTKFDADNEDFLTTIRRQPTDPTTNQMDESIKYDETERTGYENQSLQTNFTFGSKNETQQTQTTQEIGERQQSTKRFEKETRTTINRRAVETVNLTKGKGLRLLRHNNQRYNKALDNSRHQPRSQFPTGQGKGQQLLEE